MSLMQDQIARTFVADREAAFQNRLLVRRAQRARRELRQQARLERRIAALDRRRRHLEALRRRQLERTRPDAHCAA
ncbi:MAG: hypothetical protein P8Y13_04830 [Deinococcales bacterium]